MLWTIECLDGISRRPDGCCLTDERPDGCCLTDERPDGIPRRPVGWKGSNYTVLKSVQNLLETYL
jgi:hypothetical protein